MPKNNESVNRELYDLLDTRGYNPISRDSDVSQAGKTVPPEEADVFRFTFKQDGKDIDDAWATIDKARTLIVYYDKDIADKAGEKSSSAPYDDSWYGLLKFFKKWAHSRQLSFSLEPKEKLDSDMAQRTYMKKKEQIAEGYYPMGKAASYNDNIPTVKIILQHTRQIQEGEQRYRNIAKIFLENTQGERILAPTIKPGIAQVYARHLAEGGVPNDERWNHIKSLCEEYGKMAGFVRAVRGNQFNESAQRLVEAGLNHYTNLRETLGKMRGHRGYNAYFESWTPTLMENEGDDNTLNELFVQETLDPRIESVMPILNKLSKNLGEMKEVKALEEWSESIIENADIEEGMGTKILAGAALIASLLGINQYQANEVYKNSPQLQALIKLHKEAKESGDVSKVKELENRIRLQKDRLDLDKGEVVGKDGMPIQVKEAPGAMSLKHNQSTEKHNLDAFGLGEDAVEESGLQAYLGNKKYGKAGMDALRKAGRDGASKETMASIRDRYNKLDEEGMEEGVDFGRADKVADDVIMAHEKGQPYYFGPGEDTPEFMAAVADMLRDAGRDDLADEIDPSGSSSGVAEAGYQSPHAKLAQLKAKYNQMLKSPNPNLTTLRRIRDEIIKLEFDLGIKEGVAEGSNSSPFDQMANLKSKSNKELDELVRFWQRSLEKNPNHKVANDQLHIIKMIRAERIGRKGVAEDLDANQKRVGQLGPTEKVKNNNIGKLVGANESVELSEMDKSQPSSDRGGESSGDPYAKGGKATPSKAKDAEKDAEKVLNKSMDDAHKKDVKEGQEDLDAILRIIKK